ncbi:Putative Glycosyl Phosphatidyl Inositol 17 [Penicillium brasilianum]|uniref:Putative Glycosyl Phosphatidyl Inositol 17 n=1 Tax=Penicillium brasilianum TaxID=104259 RepID=A0A0F7TIK1_PENBI|nr:Putative Glycosyl Phosphatidyl Inositol 17 [Penicillium brasilianum]
MTSKNGDHKSPQISATLKADSQPSAQRVPPPETSEAIQTRFRVIAAFWAVIVFLGFPIWWKTTSIYRAHLPIRDMADWADGKTCRPVFPLEIHVAAPTMQLPESQHLVRTTQHALDDLNEFAAHHLRLKLTNDTEASTAQGIDNTPITGSIVDNVPDTALTVRVVAQEDLATPRSELRADTTQLDIFYPPSQVPIPSSSNPPLSVFIAEELQRLYSEEKATIAHILSSSTAGRDSDSISRRLRRSMKYADTYHLSFSLFTPGSAPSSWDIQAAVQEYLSPLLHAFGPISNFTIDTQVQLYATFSPMAPPPVYDETQSAWTLKKEDLSAFINAAEWPLNPSIGNGPTLNFILYVPDPSQSPMVVKENRASSWIVPQWGGVFLLNPPLEQAGKSGSQTNPAHITQESLRPAFMTFSHQLLTLLGTPTTPASLPLRLQSLIRVRAATLLLSASSTMGSLARLTESLASIPIPATVASSVSTTLAQLSATCSHLREGRFGAALASARIAETEAERSFFEKSMVGQVYFPDEHKVAVYLPLLGPIGVPLLVSLMKELKRLVAGWKAQRRSTA